MTIDFEKARAGVMDVLRGKVSTPVAVRAAKAMEDAAVELPEPPRWIPVEECLPETIPCAAGTAYSEAVIVWTSGRKAMIAVWNGEDFLCAADYWEAWGEHITHWMHLPRPLPKPPEEA